MLGLKMFKIGVEKLNRQGVEMSVSRLEHM